MDKFLVFVLMAFGLSSCGDYEAIEQIDKNKKKADSLYIKHKDSLRLKYQDLCTLHYEKWYEEAKDSIRMEQIERIEDLIGQ